MTEKLSREQPVPTTKMATHTTASLVGKPLQHSVAAQGAALHPVTVLGWRETCGQSQEGSTLGSGGLRGCRARRGASARYPAGQVPTPETHRNGEGEASSSPEVERHLTQCGPRRQLLGPVYRCELVDGQGAHAVLHRVGPVSSLPHCKPQFGGSRWQPDGLGTACGGAVY